MVARPRVPNEHAIHDAAPSCLLIALLLMAACEKSVPPPDATASRADKHDRRDSGQRRRTPDPGEVRSRYETELGFRIPGTLSARPVDSGSVVKAGDVLARLDPVDANLSATAAKARARSWPMPNCAAIASCGEGLRQRFAPHAKETAFQAARAQAELAVNQSAYTILSGPIRRCRS